jgi:glycosyltransferase involved in cell wall biosynthesis
MKKVLIITYYWPPGGGAGVQRWLKFVKYLPQFGWTPIVYTPENGEMPVDDKSLMKDIPAGINVIRRKIWEPYSLYKVFIGAGSGEKINTGFLTERKKPGLSERISVWLRGNIFIPDARRFWIGPSVKFLSGYLKNEPVDAIVSTGPPHSMHMIALKLSRKFKIPWVADFRDPWTNIDYYHDLMLTPYADRKHHRLEKQVVTQATRVVVVGKTMKEEFESAHHRTVDVITNGYDTEDITSEINSASGKFIIAHVGTLVRTRNPIAFWRALSELVNENPVFKVKLEIRLTGKIAIEVRNSLREFGLLPYVTFIEYLPHDRVISEQQNATVLLLVLNNTPNSRGILTGKLFEYLAARRPVICVGPPGGDAAEIIHETGSGSTHDFDDTTGIKTELQKLFRLQEEGQLYKNQNDVTRYSRKELTKKMVAILNEVSGKNNSSID